MKSSALLRNENRGLPFIQLFFVFMSLLFIVPFFYVISVSFSNEELLMKYGYKLIPVKFDLMAYRFVFKNPKTIIDAYIVTGFQALVGTFLATLVMSFCAYPLSRRNYRFRKPVTYFIFFTMLFGGGLIPTYILLTQYLHLRNKIWVYILPNLANAFQIIVLRTFFQGLPESLIESAKIDGALEIRIFFNIVMPLSKPAIATIALLNVLDRWNNWYTALIYISDQRLYTLQFLLQKILIEIEFIKQITENFPSMAEQIQDSVPSESMRFAMCVVAAGPMLVVFPFFQKYFTKGLTIGAIKG